MRWEKSEHLIRLALMMQSSTEGITLQDIENEFQIGRRTAERMRNALVGLFPHIDEIPDGKTKRWKLPTGAFTGLIQISAEDLTEMKTAIERLRKENLEHYADQLDGFWLKIRASLKPDRVARIETDLEALLEAEGHAMRPGPKPRINPQLLHILKDAIKGCCKVRLVYRSPHTNEVTERVIHPYGFVYGVRHYLIAWCESRKALRSFSLGDITEASNTGSSFKRDKEFKLQEYTEQSFGVFQEDPFEVVWRFSPKVAAIAKDYYFHPSQETEAQPDGSLLLKFKAGGKKEMCWHVMTWEGEAEIVKPAHLKKTYKDMVDKLRKSRATNAKN